MNTKFNTTIISLLALIILAAVAAACSDDKPAAEGQAPTASASDVQPEVEVLQSDRKFITIALARYHSSVNDIDPSVFHPWCTPPDAESVTVPPKQRKSPPVPEYLPEGVSFDKAVHEDGRHIADIYTGDGGIRLNVMYGTCLITSRAPELLEQVSVAGSWGVIAGNMKDLFETLTLYVETELGYVEIHRIDTANKGRVGKDELIEIAESLPVFGGQAAEGQAPAASAGDAQTEVEVLQGDRKFITIALSRYRSDVSGVDPSVLHPWCTHPDAESVTVPPKVRKSPPVPEYLPEGVSLHKEVHVGGTHYGSIYTSDGGNGNHIRLNVTHRTCLTTAKAPEFIEQTSVAGNWGVFLSGAKGAGSFDLHFETDLGVVSISRVITEGKEETVTKDKLIRIAESMPIFGGEVASTDTPSSDTDIMVSALGFIRVGLAGRNIDDVYPPGLHESCVSPGPGYPPPAAKMEVGPPPVPAYLPEGVSLDQESHFPDGSHIGSIYAGKGGPNSGVRVTVRHGVCESVTAPAPSDGGDSWELTSVEGNWGIFFHEDGNTILNLTMETETGFVEIRSVDLQAKQRNRIGKDELIKIAELMPVFGGAAVSAAKP